MQNANETRIYRDLDTEGRALVAEISPQIEYIWRNAVPRLGCEERAGLCENVTQNFVGALVALSLRPDIKQIFEEAVCLETYPITLEYPIIKLDEVKLYYHHKPTDRLLRLRDANSQKMFGENVIVKTGCGRVIGVIMEPPLSGMVLTQVDDINFDKWCVNRIWNDVPLVNDGKILPCYPLDFDDLPKHEKKKAENLVDTVYGAMALRYGWASAAFFSLVETTFGVKVDPNQFHRTVDKKFAGVTNNES
jgi:hypothetical protein